jgi:metallo-beta-lactamase family protein
MFTMITDYRDTMKRLMRPKVVIAASGMVTGGRVLNYLEEFISHPETTVIIVGYQGKVLGRKLLEGATEVKYMASTILFWQKIMEIKGLSARRSRGSAEMAFSFKKTNLQKYFLCMAKPARR